jgi:hypothetical protein
MHRIDLVAIALSLTLFLAIVELVRRRALSERYALLWLLTGSVLIGLSLWRGGQAVLARMMGIYYPPSALMLVAVGFILLILLHFSLVVSKLTERQKELAQRYAILAWRISEVELAQEDSRPSTRKRA